MVRELDRRSWLRLLAIPTAATPVAGQAPQGSATTSVPVTQLTKEMLHGALQSIGLNFTDEQESMMLPGVNRALNGYDNLRKIDIPLDTEPATRFYPTRPAARQSKFAPILAKLEASLSADELAFEPVSTLAALIKARRVSSSELTKMYLERLKKYSPKLLCVITLAEDLALQQAARADEEIQHGHYRGPLHGIPWGAKDLYAPKGIKDYLGC